MTFRTPSASSRGEGRAREATVAMAVAATVVKVAKTAAGSVERVGGGSGLAGLKLPSTPALRKRQGGIQRGRGEGTRLGRWPKRAGSAQWAGEAIARARGRLRGAARTSDLDLSALALSRA